MVLLIDHDLDALRHVGTQVIEIDDFVDDQIRFVAAAIIQTTLDNHNRVRNHFMTKFHKIGRPKNAAD